MLLSKQPLCGHTLFYELSHQPGWLLEGWILQAAARERGEQSRSLPSFAEGQGYSPKVMGLGRGSHYYGSASVKNMADECKFHLTEIDAAVCIPYKICLIMGDYEFPPILSNFLLKTASFPHSSTGHFPGAGADRGNEFAPKVLATCKVRWQTALLLS